MWIDQKQSERGVSDDKAPVQKTRQHELSRILCACAFHTASTAVVHQGAWLHAWLGLSILPSEKKVSAFTLKEFFWDAWFALILCS